MIVFFLCLILQSALEFEPDAEDGGGDNEEGGGEGQDRRGGQGQAARRDRGPEEEEGAGTIDRLALRDAMISTAILQYSAKG